jgi:sulfate adenylyltransferase subunit 2
MSKTGLLGLDACQVWDTELAFKYLSKIGEAETKRTAERRLHELGLLPSELTATTLLDEQGRKPISTVLNWEITEARRKRKLVLFAQLAELPNRKACLHLNDSRGARYWIPLTTTQPEPSHISDALQSLHIHVDKETAIFPHGQLSALCRPIRTPDQYGLCLLSYPSILNLDDCLPAADKPTRMTPHLQQLEAESIHIIREAVAEAENPVMLYSVGKDSSVMLRLARKAFYPSSPPFPLLHVDTRWKFQEMYLFREYMARESGMDLLVHINPEAIAKDINPFDHGSALHTDITKTEGLKQALDKYHFDMAFGGARREEEKSRAKERIFSFRSQTHRWDPKNQRPELWTLFNTRKNRGESIRVFPLSNWTEVDIWQYIYHEHIPVVPLYFAKQRPVVIRDGLILLVDDERMCLLPGEEIESRKVRFRTLGCYPLTGAVESDSTSIQEIILELVAAHNSERQGRAIASDATASMEKKKQEGYF